MPEPTHSSRSRQATQSVAAKPSAVALIGRLCGAIGIVLLASAPLTWLLAEAGPILGFKLLAGLSLIAFYMGSNRDFLRRGRGGRSNTLMALSSLSAVLVLLAIGGINYFVATHDKEFDCTNEGLFTLSAQTTETLGRLGGPVDFYGFYASQEPGYAAVEEALQRYARKSPHVHVHMIDPQSRPDLVAKFAITERGPRLVVTADGRDTRAKNIGEDELTGALVRVVEQSSKTVYFLAGHGEGDTTAAEEAEGFGSLAQAITTDGYKVDTLNLQASAPDVGTDTDTDEQNDDVRALEVPPQVDVLLVLAPVHKLLAPEVQAIENYLGRGGRLMVFEESRGNSGLAPLLQHWHIGVQDDLIVDTNPIGRLLGLGVASPIIQPTDSHHAILRGVNGAIMSTARSLSVVEGRQQNLEAVPLMQTSDSAWGETQLQQGSTIARDDKDHLPPLYTAIAVQQMPVAHAMEKGVSKPAAPDEKLARLVVFGDSDWASNRLLRLQSNEDLALNALGWLTEQDSKMTIRPNVRAQSQLYLTGEQLGTLKFFSMDIVPVLLVAFGLGIVLMRRQR